MLAGQTPLPDSDAFGSCFRRTTKPMRRYELGFDPEVLTESPRIVRNLIAGSAAETAGLRNGDEILRPVPQDQLQGTQDQLLKLAIRRGESTFDLAYLPRSETVAAWQWELTPEPTTVRDGRSPKTGSNNQSAVARVWRQHLG